MKDSPLRVPEQELFNDRPLRFILQQWALRSTACGVIAFMLGAVLVVRHGRAIREHRRLRGVELRAKIQPFTRRRAPEIAAGLGVVGAVVMEAFVLGARLGSLPDYATAWLTLKSERIAQFLSPDSAGLVSWYDGPHFYGLHSNAEVHAALVSSFGRTLPELAALFAARLLALTVLAVVLIHILRRAGLFRWETASSAWSLGGVPVPDEKACYHFLFCGSPGSGKSTAIKHLLDQIRAAGKRAIVYDLSGEYVELFYREGTDFILNPLDQRGQLWTPWAEVREDSDYTLIARSLFPQGGGQEPFWADASATLFAATMKALRDRGRATTFTTRSHTAPFKSSIGSSTAPRPRASSIPRPVPCRAT